MRWPNGKDFAFTIVDDTDHATVQNVAPVYDCLRKFGIRTTKTVWSHPPRDRYTGQCIIDADYAAFLHSLEQDGFELALHGAGSGSFARSEIIEALEHFKKKFGRDPRMHINHANNPCNLYWGYKRFGPILRLVVKQFLKKRFYGDDSTSEHFWTDLFGERIHYCRNYVFSGINTLKEDPWMPYYDPSKPFVRSWFSSSDGADVNKFVDLVQETNVDRLRKAGGCCIVYTHFASGFVDENGVLNPRFEKAIAYLSAQNGWFVPASELLDYIASQRGTIQEIGFLQKTQLDFKWGMSKLKSNALCY